MVQSPKKVNDIWESLHVPEDISFISGFRDSLALHPGLACTPSALRELFSTFADDEWISVLFNMIDCDQAA